MKKEKKPLSQAYVWRFFRAGGFDQVRLDSAADLLALENLDQKLWVALACSLDNVHFDQRTLSYIDTDNDRRIRPSELIAAIKWTASLLRNPEDLTGAANPDISIQTISGDNDEGKALAVSMQRALAALGKTETDSLSVAEIESLEKVLSQKPFNGDGIITDLAAPDDTVRTVIGEIISALGPCSDRSGGLGVDAEKVESFFAQAQAYETWYSESRRDEQIRPLGDTTGEAAETIAAVRGKIDDYFARCAVANFDEKAAAIFNAGEKHYEAMGGKPLSMKSNEIAELPLAQIQPCGPLPLGKDLNPAWADRINTFAGIVINPVLGSRETLSESEWQQILALFEPWFSLQERRKATIFDTLGIGRARELLGGTIQKTLAELIGKDAAETATFTSLVALEKLARFRRDLHQLCINFVNFKDFYAKSSAAIFQAGTLYLDQRSCGLCMKVDDVNKHAMMAAMAGTYLVYCDCRRRAGNEKMTIVAAVTNGDSENLLVGRNGIFYDRVQNDWDATITKIIENPISLRQAFWLPYKNLVRMIESQVAKRATAAETRSSQQLEQTAAATANVDKSKIPPPQPKKLDVGIVAALGVAVGALGTVFATLLGYVAGIVKLGPFAIIATLLGVLLLISGPSIILAYIKLRKRNLGPILDASGWAINAKALISVPFGTVLTHIAALPPGSQRELVDPYAEKGSLWPKVAVAALIIYSAYFALNRFGFIHTWTGGHIGAVRIQKTKVISIESVPVVAPAIKGSGQ